ncbi:uncharacterized protein LOC132274945 [Cornus florida]|uniref:uncharacterized protein LOC132274945 n=1 Tax=Cornus florida TaxID=4283 RepID=UPI00289BE7C9|nr:uncharacterized protein LOC132274945 [Cornus florida]
MLLRSSSSPVLHTSFSDSPNRDFDTTTTKVSFIQAAHHQHHLNLSSFSCNHSSPKSKSPSGINYFDPKPNNLRRNAFRRALSEGNLEGLGSTSSDLEGFCGDSIKSTRFCHKLHKTMLYSPPSFSIFNTEDGNEEEAKELGREDLVRSVTIGDSIEAMGSDEFCFGKKAMSLIQEDAEEEEDLPSGFRNLRIERKEEEETNQPLSPLMYLATGFGIDDGGGGDFTQAGLDETGNVEEYYKRMVGENPCNPLFLRNYAQLLRSKGDLLGAEDYYFRATLADPEDGEILQQYAALVWDLHHDQERALIYFKRAAQAAPDDTHVLAAYARFLWEIEDDEEEDFSQNDNTQNVKHEDLVEIQNSDSKEQKEGISSPLHQAVRGVGFTTTVPDEDENMEEYYKRMVHEEPCNPLFLRNYAQFLHQSKGDLRGAEEYYSRAILADPGDGEIISQYAKLVWELHHDRDKATCYFERAVQATPGDCYVLAAYASFLWETEEDEEEYSAREDNNQVSLFQAGAVTSANA